MESDGFVQKDGFYFDDFEILYDLEEDPTGNTTEEFLAQLKLVPNPANSIAQLSFPSFVEEGVITVYDAAGNLVILEEINHPTNIVPIDVQKLNQGVYFVRYNTEEFKSNPMRLVVIQ